MCVDREGLGFSGLRLTALTRDLRVRQEDRSAAIRAMLAKQMPLGMEEEELGADAPLQVRCFPLAGLRKQGVGNDVLAVLRDSGEAAERLGYPS